MVLRGLLRTCALIFVLTLPSGCGSGINLQEPGELPQRILTTTNSDDTVSLSVTITAPTLSREIYTDQDTAARTITISHNGAVSCSRDAGVTFGACDSDTTLIWTVSAFSTQHVIRVGSGDEVYTYSFTPSSLYPSVSMATCDFTVSSNMEFANFQSTYLGTGGTAGDPRVICLNGVTISNSNTIADTQLTIGASHIWIVGLSGTTATIANARTDSAATDHTGIYMSGKSNIFLSGLTITTAGTDGYGIYETSSTLTVKHTTITTTGSSGHGIYPRNNFTGKDLTISTSGSLAAGIRFTSSAGTCTLSNSTVTTSGSLAYGLYFLTSGTYTASGTTVTTSAAEAVRFNAATATLSNMTVSATGLSNAFVLTGTNPALTLTNSTVTASSSSLSCFNVADGSHTLSNNTFTVGDDQPVIKTSAGGGDSITIDISNNTFKRANSSSGSTYAISLAGAGTNNLNSTSNGNTFCYENSSLTFSSIVNGTNSGSFAAANQTNAGAVGACP